MNRLNRLDHLIGKNIVWVTLSCVALAVIFPAFFGKLLPATSALFAFMTFSSSLGGGFREMKGVALHPLPVVSCLLILHVLMPGLVLLLGRLLFADEPYFITGMVLEYTVPTAVATLMWVSMSRGNMALSLSIVLLDTLLTPFLIPLTLKVLVGSVVEVDAAGMMRGLLFMVALPAVVGMGLFQATGGRVAKTLQPKLSPFSKIALMLIILANASVVAVYLRNMTKTLFLVALTVFFLCLLGYLLGWFAARLLKLDYSSSLSMTLSAGMRNINAGAVLAIQYFPSAVLFPVVISSLFLQLSASVVVQLLRRTKAGREAFSSSEPETDRIETF